MKREQTIENEKIVLLGSEKDKYHAKIIHLWKPIENKLNKMIFSQSLFYCCYFIVCLSAIGLVIPAFLGNESVFSAISFGILFLTIFSFFILKFYFQSKKTDKLASLTDEFIDLFKEAIRYQDGVVEHHISLANALHKFAEELNEKEYRIFSINIFRSLNPILEKFSCICFWKDILSFRELLFLAAVKEYIKVVKNEPTNLRVHAGLANAYVLLASLYSDPTKQMCYSEDKYIPADKFSQETADKFREIAKKAIEELNILRDYAPQDPWVHVQLAYSYHDLQMPKEEIKEYEIVLRYNANDVEILLKLGMLYFQQGMNSVGLKVYELLRKLDYKKAETLIKLYGTYESDN